MHRGTVLGQVEIHLRRNLGYIKLVLEAAFQLQCKPHSLPYLFLQVSMLMSVHKMAKSQGADRAAEQARSIVPINLVRASLHHTTEQQKESMRAALNGP